MLYELRIWEEWQNIHSYLFLISQLEYQDIVYEGSEYIKIKWNYKINTILKPHQSVSESHQYQHLKKT